MGEKWERQLGCMRKCPVCGKDFFIPDLGMWVYKRCNCGRVKTSAYKFFCSWTCFRKYEKDNPRKNKSLYDTPEDY